MLEIKFLYPYNLRTMNTYLAKIGELTLKGSNIKEFERLLVKNIKFSLEDIEAKVTLRSGRLYIEAEEKYDEQVSRSLDALIGITGWAKTIVAEKNIEDISRVVYELCLEAKKNGAKTFKCDSRRADKGFPLNSYEISREAAAKVFDENLLQVDVHNPDVTVSIEVREKVYIFSDQRRTCRGLPVGSSGKGLLLLSGGIDSPVAGYRMMRRGMKVDCVYFHSYPYTSDEAQKKVEDLAARLSLYGLQTHLHIVSFTDTQMQIKKSSPEPWSTLLLRMCMMRASNQIAYRIGAQCIITGESLGQVASQTIENMKVTESMAEFPLIRPLVGLDKEEITQTAEFIDTYRTSILPYEDCCVLFSPRHPVLRAKVEEAKEIYEAMNIDSFVDTAVETRVIKRFRNGKEYTE